ncbi:hypothetical protein [Citrobacter sp. JGM124]|nr:hypothetical protein [Citrobacter sp. JGM124]
MQLPDFNPGRQVRLPLAATQTPPFEAKCGGGILTAIPKWASGHSDVF